MSSNKMIALLNAKKIDGDNVAFFVSVGVLLSVGCLVSSSLKAQPPQGDQQTAIAVPVEEDVEQWIAPEIQGHERDVMREIIRLHPVDARENVTYIAADGTVYGSNLQSKNVQTAVPAGNGLYTYDGIESFSPSTSIEGTSTNVSSPSLTLATNVASPSLTLATNVASPSLTLGSKRQGKYETCGFNVSAITTPTFLSQVSGSTTGAFVRIKSSLNSNNYGWSRFQGEPNAVSIYEVGSIDTVYFYAGFSDPFELDGGIQHSKTNNNWSLFTNYDNRQISRTDHSRYLRVNKITVEVIKNGLVRTTVDGNGMGLEPLSQSQDRDVPSARLNGLGHRVKHVTSIAQTPTNPNSGSSVSGGWSKCILGTHSWNRVDTYRRELNPSLLLNKDKTPKVSTTFPAPNAQGVFPASGTYNSHTDSIDLKVN
jgi:hypothetical protein